MLIISRAGTLLRGQGSWRPQMAPGEAAPSASQRQSIAGKVEPALGCVSAVPPASPGTMAMSLPLGGWLVSTGGPHRRF